MARPRKPWFRKSNKSWYVESHGKQVNLGRNKKEAFKLFHEMMAQPDDQEPKSSPSAISLPELVDHFLEWVQRNRAPDTYEWYRYRLERLCKAHPRLAASRIMPFHVEEWVNSYDLSITSRRNYFCSAKRCYSWGKRQGHIKTNPIADMEVPSAEHREVSLSQEEFDHLITFVRNPSLADLMNVTWLTGCRPQESLIVEARNVDLENQRWIFETSKSKGKKVSRVVYMNDNAMEIVRRLMAENPSGTLFRNTNGQPWKKDAVNCAVDCIRVRMGKEEMRKQGIEVSDQEVNSLIPKLKPIRMSKGKAVNKRPAELRKEAKKKLTYEKVVDLVPRYSLYALRHSFATNALRKGIDSLTVAVLLGHQDPSTLARVYQHLNQNPEHLLEQVKKASA